METSKSSVDERLTRVEHIVALTKPVLTFNEAAAYTGLSKSYLYKLTASRQIPHSKPMGKQLYFDREELDQWLLRNEVKTADKIEAEAAAIVTLKRHKKSGRK